MHTKKDIAQLERKIKVAERNLRRAQTKEGGARNKWKSGFGRFNKNLDALAAMAKPRTQRERALWDRIMKFRRGRNVSATRSRDEERGRIAEAVRALTELRTELALIRDQHVAAAQATDEIVTQVFSLNEMVVRAANDRTEFLKRHFFSRMVDANGDLRTQISFDSVDGLRRVVVRVNQLTKVDPDLASQAQTLIHRFFESFRDPSELPPAVQILYGLTKELLMTRSTFKIGPSFYRFISMEIDPEVSKDLAQAQDFLRQSLRSEKTNSYIKLYRRESRSSPWVEIPQS